MKKKISIKKNDPLFQPFMKAYYEWYQKQIGIAPRIDGADGKALKMIIKYLRSITANNFKAPKAQDTIELQSENKNKDLKTLLAWDYIFANYDKWDKFYQQQLSLRQINSNINNIIISIKNGRTRSTEGKSISDIRAEIGDLD